MKPIVCDSIIFDLDGTLWDSCSQAAEAWTLVLSRYPQIQKKISRQDIRNVMGLTASEIGLKFFPELSPELRDQIIDDCANTENEYLAAHGGTLYDGLEETLSRLSKDYPLFIVSNCQAGYIEAFLEYHGLACYFTDFLGEGHTGLSKRENISLIINRNHLLKPVYLGDTHGDFAAASGAGIPFLFASYGFGHVEEVPEISAISCLPDVLTKYQPL